MDVQGEGLNQEGNRQGEGMNEEGIEKVRE